MTSLLGSQHCTREVSISDSVPGDPATSARTIAPIHVMIMSEQLIVSVASESADSSVRRRALVVETSGVTVDYTRGAEADPLHTESLLGNAAVRIRVASVAVHNFLCARGFRFPVIFASPRADNAAARTSDTNGTDATAALVVAAQWPAGVDTVLRSVSISAAPCSVWIEGGVVAPLAELWNRWRDAARRLGLLPRESPRERGLPLRIDTLAVGELEAQVTVRADLKLYLSVEGTVVLFDPLVTHDVWAAPRERLWDAMSKHYLAVLPGKLGWAVGSLGILGNPAAFARSVSKGVRDMVQLPLESARHDGALGFVGGVRRGNHHT